MKKTIQYSLILLMTAVVLYSCKSDSPTGTGIPLNNDYFNWTVEDTVTSNVNDISVADADNVFIAGYPCYRINNGVKTFMNFEPEFFAKIVRSYNKDYAVFGGALTGFPEPTNRQIKVYNNGAITSYQAPLYLGNEFGDIFIIQPGKFLLTGRPGSRFYLFDNGIFNEYTLADTSAAYKFGVVNNSIYIFAMIWPQNYIYKFENNQPVFVRSEPMEGVIYSLNNDIIRTYVPGTTQYFFDYFTDASWVRVNSSVTPYQSYARYITGDSKNFLLGITRDSVFNYRFNVWNGSSYNEEVNFPSNINSLWETNPIISNYRGNTVYFYSGIPEIRLYKGRKTRN